MRTHHLLPACRHAVGILVLSGLAAASGSAQSRVAAGQLVSRAELLSAESRAEIAAKRGDQGERARNATLAAAIRQRLREGDFQVGDRVILTVVSDAVHRDTLVVRTGPSLQLPGKIDVPISGLLRSELLDRVSTEVLKYVKAQQIEVTPLMRVGIMGAVARPGYFAFPSDLPLTDAIMGAGGLAATADVDRTVVRRGNLVYRSADETRRAIASGLTLDQFGLNAGDDLVIGSGRTFNPATALGLVGSAVAIVGVIVTLQRH